MESDFLKAKVQTGRGRNAVWVRRLKLRGSSLILTMAKDDNNKNFTLLDLPKNRGLHRFVFSSNLNPPLGWKTDCIDHHSKETRNR